jgi:signal transduction histidine kinase
MDNWLELFAQANFRRSADTAHDLKTPLNVAVLNLELLRMRVRKLTGADDEKLNEYTRALEMELRRMARIFDTFFLLSTPPRGEDMPAAIDVGPISAEEASAAGYTAESASGKVFAHEARIRQALKMFFEGASKILKAENRRIRVSTDDSSFTIVVTGQPAAADFELTKIFKFYYTDPVGDPDLSLATARLIVETYGGELNASQESDKVHIRFSLPLGDR